jgi:acyl carrier protein
VQNTRPNLSTPFIPPKTLIESKLTQIWADLLSLDRVGIDDNFFDLGGHSLTATQLVSRIISQFRLDLPLQALFQSPTVAEMAAVIAKYQETLNDQELNRLLVELEFLSDEDAQRLLDVSDERLE